MSTNSRDSCCLSSVKKQKHDFQVFAFVQCIIKQLLDSVFVISRIIKVSVRVISLSLRLRLITLTSTLIILDITKTSSNNCLKAADKRTRNNPYMRLNKKAKAMRCPFQRCKLKRLLKYKIFTAANQFASEFTSTNRLVYLFVGVWWQGDFAWWRVLRWLS